MTHLADSKADAAAHAPFQGTSWLVICVYCALTVCVLGYFLLGMPVQLTDSFGNMLKLESSWSALMRGEFTQHGYLRPLLWAQLKAVFDVAGGHYTAWFRGVHVLQIAALVALFVHLVRPRGWRDAAVLPLALSVLFGIHTFAGMVTEAFPINTFLTIVIFTFVAAALSLAPHRWWTDIIAVLLFVGAALTVESGLLVGVVFVGAALVGARGVSRAGIAAVVVATVGYFVVRFGVFAVGSPGLIERSSGFGSRVLDPAELTARFGNNPLPFYLYNVVTSAVSVLFSEPRQGVFQLLVSQDQGFPPAALLNIVSSLLATAVIAWYAWSRRQQWIARDFDRDDRIVLLFCMVLAANAVISYPYTKDVIMSPAGAFYALALFAATRHFITAPPFGRMAAVRTATWCVVLSTTWAARDVALHMKLRHFAAITRNEWAYAEGWLEGQNIDVSAPRARALFRLLQNDAIGTKPAPPLLPGTDRPVFEAE